MSETKTQLGEGQLVRYLGAKCHYEFYDTHSSVWGIGRGELSSHILWRSNLGRVRNIRPVLRPLASISWEESNQLFVTAFEREPAVKLRVLFSEGGILFYEENPESFALHLSIFPDMRMSAEAKFENETFVAHFNAVAVVDYLRSLHFDLDSMIQNGLAIDANTRRRLPDEDLGCSTKSFV